MAEAYPSLVFIWALLSGAIFLLGIHIRAGLTEGLSMHASAALAVPATLGLALLMIGTPLQEGLSRLQGRTLLLTAFLLINGLQISRFLFHHTDDVYTTARQLRPYLHPGTVILGDLADTLSFESNAFAVRSYLGMNRNAFERFHPDYVLDVQQDASTDVPQRLNAKGARDSYPIRFVQRFGLLPLDEQQTLYKCVVDLYAVEKPLEAGTHF
jgi:hypothetical protein